MSSNTTSIQMQNANNVSGKVERALGWYRYLVHNRTVAGSLFTLVHLPFMLAFLSLALFGTMTVVHVDLPILALSMAAVALLLYGEHMIDDTTMFGKPWRTIFKDRSLITMAAILFVAAGCVGIYGSFLIGSPLPILGVALGIGFCLTYGFEIWKFHTVWFGAVGMGAIALMSYLAQTTTQKVPIDPLTAILLWSFGSAFSYVLLALYEHTKTDAHDIAWRLLGVQFITGYILATMAILAMID